MWSISEYSGHNVPPIKDTSKHIEDGLTANGDGGREPTETTETDSSGTGGMRDTLEGTGTTQNDPIHLKRRVGLFSGVALIVGTMIGKF